MRKKCDSISIKDESKVKIDLSSKSPHEIIHLMSVLKRLQKEGKIRIRVV